jgi:L-2-hydroxyglutarate oxidase LhgO
MSPVTRKELLAFGNNLVSLGKGSKHDLYQMMKYEIPKLSTSNLVRASSKLVPSAMQVKDWTRKKPGIRGQLIDSKNGELLQDFLVEHSESSTHILNAVSPGWTAGIPFGRSIAQSVLERLNEFS